MQKILDKLILIISDLKNKKYHEITRLTIFKGPCKDPDRARRFAEYLAMKSFDKISNTEEKDLKDLALRGIKAMKNSDTRILHEIKEYQNEYRNTRWAIVRSIISNELLIIEEAIEIHIDDTQIPEKCYKIARSYCETYNPSYGTGLTPDSIEHVEDVYAFWKQESEMDLAKPST